MDPADFYQTITQKMIAALENGTAPWIRPWRKTEGGQGSPFPVNAVTGRPYRGVNALTLSLHAISTGSADMRFATFRQAKDQGWGVKKGATGLPVLKLVPPGETAARSQGERPQERRERDGEEAVREKEKGNPPSNLLFPRIYHVFAAENLVGIPDFSPKDETAGKSNLSTDLPGGLCDKERSYRVSNRLKDNLRVRLSHGGDRAFYNREEDRIRLPSQESFLSLEGYLGTLFHEFGHATGHESRLNRTFGVRGTPEYAFEELVAELASLFVGMKTGVSPDGEHFDNHAAYIGSWVAALENDRRALVRAATLAQEACDLLMKNLEEGPGTNLREEPAEREGPASAPDPSSASGPAVR
jgi:antirestriction protein ArdC